MPSVEALRGLGLREVGGEATRQQASGSVALNPFASIIPFLSGLPGTSTSQDKEAKPARFLVVKGLPTLPMKLVEKAWNMEFVEMEDFLPAPRSLRIAEQGKPSSTLQESLVGALSEFQARQQQKSQRRVTDIMTWTRCFSLYVAVMAKKSAEMIPHMVAHLHTVLRLQQKASYQLAWLEYDIQFRMELAASDERTWTCGDPWKYVSCLPGPQGWRDPFEVSETPPLTPVSTKGKGKRPVESEGDRGASPGKPATKKARKGLCRLHNTAPGGCPYGNECIFLHRCI